jgi:hypothetical protein
VIVTVAGMRDWKSRTQVFNELGLLLIEHMEVWELEHSLGEFANPAEALAMARREFVLRHGASGNVDNWANEWGLERGVTIECFHAEWHDPSGAYNSAAGPIRNRKMAQAQPKADLWLAFWNGKFRQRGQRKVSGSFDGICAALEAGIDVAIKPPR